EYQIARYAIPASAPLAIINQVVIADINGDGHPDVAILHNDGASLTTHKWIDVFMGQANGTFTEPTAPIDLGSAITTPTMTLFDQNGDGKTDIFLEDGTKFTAYLGNNDGTFGVPVVTNFQTLLIPLSLNKLSEVTNASFQEDLSGDGIPDLVVSGKIPSFVQSGSHYALYVFKGQASGSYNLATPSFSDTSDNLTLLTTRELSSDNKPDIVAYGSLVGPDVASSIFVFRNTGNGAFTQSFHSPTFSNGLPTIVLGGNGPKQQLLTPDLTNDGIDDMILVEGGLGTNNNVTLHIEKNNGNGGFTETQQIPFISFGSYDSSGLVEDVDGDGLPDLVVYRFATDNGTVETSMYFNHGGGVFDSVGLVPVPSVTPGTYPGLADFNGDGKLDLVYTGFSAATQKNLAEVLLNTTGRAFGAGVDTDINDGINLNRHQTIPPDPILDYTGDGLPDLVGYFGDNWNILASTGDGHFTTLEPPPTFGGVSVPMSATAADINNDGKIDLIFGIVAGLNQVDENTPGLLVDMNGVGPPADTAGGDPSTARDLGTLTGPISLTEFVNTAVNTPALSAPLDSNDFYKFTLLSAQTVRVSAIGAGGTVSVVLQNSIGAGLASSTANPGEFDATLAAGTYYVGVGHSGGGDTHYRLDISLPAALPGIDVLQGFATIINGQTSSIDFGSVMVAATDTHKVFTISNDGLATLNLGTISLPTGFELDGAAPPSALAPGASAAFSVMMDTHSAGQYSGTISIPSTDPMVDTFSFAVSGSVSGPVLSDLNGQFAAAPALPASLIAGQSAPLSFTLANAGPGAAAGTYSIAFMLEKGSAQLGHGDATAGTASGAVLLAANGSTSAIAGSVTVPAGLAAGTYFLAATITHGGGDIDTNSADKTFFSGPITIGPPPTHLAFLQQPGTTAIAGHTIGPIVSVQLLDASNHLVASNADVTIALTVNPNNATLGGTLSVSAVNGVATFNNLSLTVASSYTFTATSGALTSPKSGSFTVLPDSSSASLFIAPRLLATTVGVALKPSLTVDIEDPFGNIINTGTDATSTVTLQIVSGPGGTFGGASTLNAKAAKGVATFSSAALSMAGSYSLGVTDAALGLTVPQQFTQTIDPGTTSVAAPHASAAYTFGPTINLSATFKSSAPASIPFTGTASIVDQNSQILGTASLSSNGSIKFALAGIFPGSYQCTVSYPGDANHAAVTSSGFTILINKASTKTVLTASSTTLVLGQPLTLTATVNTTSAPGTPRTGSINFFDGATLLQNVALSGSSANWTFTPATIGSHSYKAVYSADGNFSASISAALARSVGKDKTSIQLMLEAPAASPMPHNQTFNLDILVTIIAPGSSSLATHVVTIKDNGKVLGTLNLDSDGVASLMGLTYTTSGSHSLTALYAGDADTLAVTSPVLRLNVT
ncbi:MAG TPA: FG-GAP-like repeat-containing protein, partial [Phycisphaerae bacterium]